MIAIPSMKQQKRKAQKNTYGFKKSVFPLEWKDHLIVLLSNRAYVDAGGDIIIHLDITCTTCMDNSIVRFSVSGDLFDVRVISSLSKWLCLSPFIEPCELSLPGTEHKIP